MTAQMYNSCIHHPSLFSSHQSKPTKSPASPFLSLQMSSVEACLRHCRREKGQILCVNFDFLEFCLSSALLMGPLKLSQKGGRLCECGHVKCQHGWRKTKKKLNVTDSHRYREKAKTWELFLPLGHSHQTVRRKRDYCHLGNGKDNINRHTNFQDGIIALLIFYRILIVMRH